MDAQVSNLWKFWIRYSDTNFRRNNKKFYTVASRFFSAEQVMPHAPPQTPSQSSGSCPPNSLDKLSNTNIVCLELVDTNTDGQGRNVEAPPEELVKTGMCSLGDIVDDGLLDTQVGVDEEETGEDGIGGGVEGAGSEGSDGDGDEAGGEESLEGPVVGAVGGAGLRNRSWVVDCRNISFHVKDVVE